QISDPAGALVTHVSVSLQSAEHSYKQNVMSDDRGMFSLLQVSPGRYTLTVAAPSGFDDYSVQLQVGSKAPALIKIVLTLAHVQQQTKVEASQNDAAPDPGDNRDQVVTTANMLEHLPVLD